jgi:outer membrane protein assembly factor BamD (BamD/ComL family)
MSISALSSNLISDLSQQQNPFREIRQDFQQLASALQSGDLTDAQSAYSNIQQVLQGNSGSSNSGGSSTLQNDFAALGQALQSGDLSTAQSAFSQLQSDVQATRQTGGGGRWATQNQGQSQGTDQYVSSSSQGQNPAEEAIQDYTQLASDLQSGNLTGAQSAYSNLQQLVQAASTSSTSATTPTTVQTDFATLGQDLQAGNLTQSQSAFSQLQSDLVAASQPPSAAATAPTTSTTTPTESPVQQVQQDYLQLANALQSGSLTGAQSAFTALEQALQTQSGTSTTAAATSATSNDPIANDLSSLSQALTSGNLTQAQSAFSQLQTDIQAAQQSGASQAQNATQPQKFQTDESHRHHHHHGGDDGGSSSQSSSSTSSATNAYTSSTNSSSVNVYA